MERFLARTIPGPAVTITILVLGDSGQRLNLAVATGLTAVALGLLAFVAQLFGRAVAARWRSGHGSIVAVLLALAGSWVLGTLLSGASHGAAGAALGAAVVIVAAELARYPEPPGPADDSRRRLLASVTVAGVFGVGSYHLGSRRSGVTSAAGDGRGAGSAPRETGALLADARERSLSVEGLEPLVSEEFYEVDINAVNPEVERSSWTLRVHGAVDTELRLDFDDVRSLPARQEFVTPRCVGDTLNGRKMDNALWTVSDVGPLLDADAARPGDMRHDDGHPDRRGARDQHAVGLHGRVRARGGTRRPGRRDDGMAPAFRFDVPPPGGTSGWTGV